MSDLSAIKDRIDAGDAARFFLDFYGSHWIELTSSSIIPWKTRIRLAPHEILTLRDCVARRAKLIPPKATVFSGYYRRYRGGVLQFVIVWAVNECRSMLALRREADPAPAAANNIGSLAQAYANTVKPVIERCAQALGNGVRTLGADVAAYINGTPRRHRQIPPHALRRTM